MGTSNQKLSETSFFTSAWGNLRNAIIGCSAAVLFGLAVLLMSILSVTNPSSVFPQNNASPAAEIAVVESKVDYYLPYPGILPDNPLYNLKAIRDRVRLWLIFDEGKKAQRELLYADKRINAAVALVAGGKAGLGVSTASKAEKYLEQAVDRVTKLQKVGQDVDGLLLTLAKATAKHVEIIEGLIIKTTGADRVGLETTFKQSQALAEKVAQALRE